MEVEEISNIIKDRYPKGCIIGITGKGAAGKSTFAANLNQLLNPNQFGVTCFDDFIEPHQIRYNKDNELLTGYHPKAFQYKRARKHVVRTIKEYSIKKLNYPIFEGVSAMHYGFKEFYDYSIFLDCDLHTENERRHNRIADSIRLKYMEDKKNQLFEARKNQFNKYIKIHEKQCSISLLSEYNYNYKLVNH